MASLPPFGWTTHSAQIGAEALAAHAWSLNTTLHAGKVLTSLLDTPPPEVIAMLEKIAAKHAEHRKTCTDPNCATLRMSIHQLCPNGKFDPTQHVFYTVAFDLLGRDIPELRVVSMTPETAEKAHYDTCTLLVGALTVWGATGEECPS